MVFVFDEFQFDTDKLELRRSSRTLKAEALVLRLLEALVRNAGQLVTKDALLEELWHGRPVADNVVTVAMSRLRKLLGRDREGREFISNAYGRGYRFERPVNCEEVAPPPLLADELSGSTSGPFVGRVRVLARLRAERDEARVGRGGACVLVGEAGIGKTRAIEVIAHDAAAAGMMVAWGHCREVGAMPPLWPVAQLLGDLLRKLELASPDPRAGAAVEELRELLARLERDNGSSQLGPEGIGLTSSYAATYRLFDAIIRAMTEIARHTPCILILDDIHRADVTSLLLLRHWIDELAHAPILVLGTMRKLVDRQAPASQVLLRVLGHRNCTRIELERLSEAEVADYVAALFDDASGALTRAMYEKSEGNPFYMIELARQLSNYDHPSVENVIVTEAALDLVTQRMSGLDDAARGVLSCAAVIGRSFEIGLLQSVTKHEPGTLMASLDAAVASDAIHVDRHSRTTFSFAHDLLRAALYDALPASARRRFHLEIGLALEQRSSNGDTVPAADLAYHFEAALPDSDLRRAVHYCSLASTVAAEVCAFHDALRYLRQARTSLELMDKPSQRLRAAMVLRQATYARVSSATEFHPLLDELISIGRAQRSGAILAGAGFLLDLHPGFPPLRGADEVFADALRFLPAEDSANRAAVLARRATCAPLAFDAKRANEQVDNALALCPEPDLGPASFAIQLSRLYLLGGPGHEDAAEQLLTALEARCQKTPAPLSVVPILIELHRCITALQAGQLAESNQALKRLEARCRALGSRELIWQAERFRLLAGLNAIGPAQHLGQLRELHRRAARERILGTELFGAYDRCVVLGDVARGSRGALQDALRFDSGDPPSIWSLKVRAFASAGMRDEARVALYARPAESLADLPCDRDYLGTLGALARAALALNARDYIEMLYVLLEPHAERFAVHVSFACDGSVAQLLGGLARALDRRADAVRHLEAAVAISLRAGLGPCTAEARVELGACKRAFA